MLICPAPLAALAARMRRVEQALATHVEATYTLIETTEPKLLALLPHPERRQYLLQEAAALRERFPDNNQRPPLYGIVVGVKDIFRVEGFETRAGSQLPPELFAGPEAESVKRLRTAGAIILGKTVSTEFAYFEPGPTRNPHNPEHTPGGSSSGSAAAVAAGFCSLGLGTQTIGSVIRPAAFCGVVGFKPGFGRIPTEGLIAFSPSVDQVGMFTQDVSGMELAASILCDNWQPSNSLDTTMPVLGVPDGPYLAQASPEGLTAFESQLATLQAAGYEVRRVPALSDIAEITNRHQHLVAAELAQVHAEWFARYEPLYRPRTAKLIREGQAVSVEQLEAGRASLIALRTALENLRQQNGIDLWVSPAAPGPAPQGLEVTGSPVMNLPWTHAGLPTISLPAGYAANGLPLGLQISAGWNQDEQLLVWAAPIADILAEN